MKKFCKITLIIAAIMLIVGIGGVAIVGMSTGFKTMRDAVGSVGFKIEWFPFFHIGDTAAYPVENIDEGFLGDADKIEIDIGGGEIKILPGDSFSVKAEGVPIGSILCDIQDGKFFVKQAKDTVRLTHHYGTVIITLPDNKEFSECNITLGGGEAEINGITAKSGTLTIGGGELHGKNLSFENTAISFGAGEVALEDCSLGSSNITGGVGSLEVSGSMSGSCVIENGIGEVSLKLHGDMSDYYFTVSGGIGEVSINEHSFAGSVDTAFGSADAKNRFDISNGIGEIDIEIK